MKTRAAVEMFRFVGCLPVKQRTVKIRQRHRETATAEVTAEVTTASFLCIMHIHTVYCVLSLFTLERAQRAQRAPKSH